LAFDSDCNVNALNGWTYAYDAEGRLTTAVETGSNDQLHFTYDQSTKDAWLIATYRFPIELVWVP